MPESWVAYQGELLAGCGTSLRERDVEINKAEGTWRPEEHFDIRYGDAEFGVCPASFQSCFALAFPGSVSFPPFWNGNVYSVPLCVGGM